MAGAEGTLPDMGELLAELLQRQSFTVVVVCGRNEALSSSLTQAFNTFIDAGQLRVFGYIDRMQELMALSTCIITKPGGVTLAEALASGLPIFAYRPVPGQERNNALYLENKGAAAIAYTPEQLSFKIYELIHDSNRIRSSRAAIMKLQRKNAADVVALDFCSPSI